MNAPENLAERNAAIETQADSLVDLLRERGHRYFSDFEEGSISVNLMNMRRRRYSALYKFALNSIGKQHNVFVKIPWLEGVEIKRENRPYVAPEVDPRIKFHYFHAALAAIQDHFRNLNDPRFGAIRVLDLIEEHGAFVMEEMSAPMLQDLFATVSRFHVGARPADLDSVFHNAGAWLGEFHMLDKKDNVKAVNTKRTEFIALTHKFIVFLSDATGNRSFFQDVAKRTETYALGILPENLPLGLRFGDYWMTNILVGPNNRVTGFDTVACWRVPIYEDIAYFLAGLYATRQQIASQGLAFDRHRLAHYEKTFLCGYFGEQTIPVREIQLYQVLRLLERWSGRATRVGKLSGVLLNRYFSKVIDDVLQAINDK
ncbi:MAG: aminoglycoside phosphotransferase family protein [Gammaproteobacteria bacterium]|nr:aminoglycoside phosphotransferase family protein [Gammaproteobacteria bacterium]